ncbi:hypothetical protein [Bacillus sp. FJAT-27445]|uniref:hypothetical protein n=1 Tax=Bacillus sp. FJAT-27445 TaxID=1679166 RepID=UPI0007443B0E|nr:hypothetical protein [Bacillus sp. FJAT-27445]
MRKRTYQDGFMQRKWLVLLAAILIALLLFIIISGIADNKEMTISEVAGEDFEKITKIVFRDGRGKNQPFSLEDAGKIDEFLGQINGYVVKKEKNHEKTVGWNHGADFYIGNKKVMSIIFKNPLIIDGKYYETIKGQMKPADIDHFIQSVNPEWKLP